MLVYVRLWYIIYTYIEYNNNERIHNPLNFSYDFRKLLFIK